MEYQEIVFSFVGAQQYELLKDHTYTIQIVVVDGNLDGGDVPNVVYLKAHYDASGSTTHDGNEAWFSNNTWQSNDLWDTCFYVYGELVPPQNVTLTVSDGANGTINPPAGVYTYQQYTYSIAFTATPNSGYIFSHWLVDGTTCQSQNPIVIYMDANHTLQPVFSTAPPSPEYDWVSPTGHEDTDWVNPTNAYDEDVDTYASISVNAYSYSSFLILTHAVLRSNRIRYRAYHPAGTIFKIDVDVFKDDQWVDVYEGNFTNNVWEDKSFSDGNVTKARIRFYNGAVAAVTFYLYEFDFVRLHAPIMAVKIGGNFAILLSGSDKGKIIILI